MPDLFSDTQPATASATGRYAQVSPEAGLEKFDSLTYAVPAELAGLAVGDRVLVPLGRRRKMVGGYVLSLSDRTELAASRIKSIHGRDPAGASLPADLLELGQWISRYYCCPLGMVLSTMLPAAVKKGTGLVKKAYVELAEPLRQQELDQIAESFKLRGQQKKIIEKLLELTRADQAVMEVRALAGLAGARTRSAVLQLIEKGVLEESQRSQIKAVELEADEEASQSLTLNDEQNAAIDQLREALSRGFSTHLLLGVTGSGKTEVYIRVLESCVAAGRGAIVLVPEIALTPQTVRRFTSRFPKVAVLHSGLSAAQRHHQWSTIQSGQVQVVVGARSAIFAPIKNLGLIIVDEEHDHSYKQDQSPRYNARDVAVKRAQMSGALAILGSATPSLESYANAVHRKSYHLLKLTRRPTTQSLPGVEVVDMTQERGKRREYSGSASTHHLSIRLEKSLGQVFKEGGQAILLLNRRGYASFLACADSHCGWMKTCEHCDVAMVYHKDQKLPRGGLVKCHYCSYENLLPQTCPVCGKKVNYLGLGTQKIEEEITGKFPDIRMIRMDSDAMRRAEDYRQSFNAFRRGEVQLLVGTQMIAKGLDFPNVRLVGVVSADTALSFPDFRASERTFQLVCQVAGRCGRGDHPGRVIVQSYMPEHPAIQLAAKHDYQTFAADELALRKKMGLPPFQRMARIVVRDMDLSKAQGHADTLGRQLLASNESLKLGAAVHGPMPAPIARIGGYYRFEIQIIAEDATRIQKLLGRLREAGQLISDARCAVDVDPLSLL